MQSLRPPSERRGGRQAEATLRDDALGRRPAREGVGEEEGDDSDHRAPARGHHPHVREPGQDAAAAVCQRVARERVSAAVPGVDARRRQQRHPRR